MVLMFTVDQCGDRRIKIGGDLIAESISNDKFATTWANMMPFGIKIFPRMLVVNLHSYKYVNRYVQQQISTETTSYSTSLSYGYTKFKKEKSQS